MYRNFKIIRPCLLVLFLASSVTLFSTDFTRNITKFFDVSGSEINDLFVIKNAEGLNSTTQDLQDKTNQTKILANIFETRIDKITHLLETTSEYPSVRNISYANLISTEFMGIPEASDIEKRNTAEYLLKNESVLGGVYFTLPNGDVYLGEPYSAQKQLPRLNFADRDWYKGVSKTNETYISSVFLSASTRAPATAIAVPVYQDNSKFNLVGYWVGIINIGPLWKTIKDHFLTATLKCLILENTTTLIYDQHLPLMRTAT